MVKKEVFVWPSVTWLDLCGVFVLPRTVARLQELKQYLFINLYISLPFYNVLKIFLLYGGGQRPVEGKPGSPRETLGHLHVSERSYPVSAQGEGVGFTNYHYINLQNLEQ